MREPSITLMYHFFYPDDVVSARHFTQFAEGLRDYGWKVTVLTSNRYCRYHDKTILPKKENWNGIEIIRAYRPGWNQSNNYLRILNAIYILLNWSLHLLCRKKSDVIIVGTDPQFAALIFPFLRIFRRGKILAHWCYDLYPEAIISNEPGFLLRFTANITKIFMHLAYKFVDIMIDIGFCMRELLKKYNHHAHSNTLVPWALVEPNKIPNQDNTTRKELFGSNAELTILYSGNMGKAHDFLLFLSLARNLRDKNPNIVFCFACRGNRYDELLTSVKDDDTNIRFAGFASEEELEKRLSAADIHLVSLRSQWTGIVVPSKFFGSLAVGKPIIFNGPDDSAISQWIREYHIGWVLNSENIEYVSSELLAIAKQEKSIKQYSQNAYDTYHKHFSQTMVIKKWDNLLRNKLQGQ